MKRSNFYFFDDLFNFNFDSLFEQVESKVYYSKSLEAPKLDLEKLVKEEEIFDKGNFELIVTSYKDADGKLVYTRRETKPKGWEKLVEIKKLKEQMNQAIKELNFEDAANYRDQIKKLQDVGKLEESEKKEGE